MVALVVIMVAFAAGQSVLLARLRRTPIAAIDVASVPDGAYQGRGRVGVAARVTVIVEEGRIVDLRIVTGATTTSRAIQKAAEAALRGR